MDSLVPRGRLTELPCQLGDALGRPVEDGRELGPRGVIEPEHASVDDIGDRSASGPAAQMGREPRGLTIAGGSLPRAECAAN